MYTAALEAPVAGDRSHIRSSTASPTFADAGTTPRSHRNMGSEHSMADESRHRRPARRRAQTIKRDDRTSQLIERGEGPEEPVGSFEDSPSEFTTEGGRGTNTPDRWGGPRRNERNDPPNPRTANTGGEGGYSTLGGGTYYGEGDPDDAPGYGDWGRNATGASSGARGQEGFDYPGEHTWGETQREQERPRPARGRHAGRGPRGYRRSDATIREEICESLTDNPDLDASGIEVTVEGGEVTLTGTVDSRDARWLAEDLVESVAGVRDVHNQLRVAHG
jgi:osmotically-inducible protein OsmY